MRSILLERLQSQVQKGEYAAGELLARRLLEVEPQQRDARFLLAVSLFLQGRYEESLAENRLLLKQHPDFDEGRLQLGNLLQTTGKAAAAAKVYRDLARTGKQMRLRQTAAERFRALEEARR